MKKNSILIIYDIMKNLNKLYFKSIKYLKFKNGMVKKL